MASHRHPRVARGRMAAKMLLLLGTWCFFQWQWSLNLSSSLTQVLPAATWPCQPASRLVVDGWKESLDAEKLKACEPKRLQPEELKEMLHEAKEPKRKPCKKRTPRTDPDRPGFWRCPVCEQMLPEEAFYKVNSQGRRVIASSCKECDRIRKLRHYRTLRGGLQLLLGNAKQRAKVKQSEFTLCLQDLIRMVDQQSGRCAYSGVPLEMCVPNSHWRMSLERRNNSKGYSSDNCVLVAAEFNTIDSSRKKGVDKKSVHGTAQWSAAKLQSMFHLRQKPVDLTQLHQDIRDAKVKPRISWVVRGQAMKGRHEYPGKFYCPGCAMNLEPGKFSRTELSRGGPCKACTRRYQQAYYSTLRGHVQSCLGHAKQRAKKRGQQFSLTPDQVLILLGKQQGRCYYSGVPLVYKRIHTDWRLSIERLDNSVGYTADNCVLIAIEFNTSDQSRNKATTKVFGTAQWSREKVWRIWGHDGWAKTMVPLGKNNGCIELV